MAKIEDILKQQGYTDADIQAAGPLLADARFRGAVENTLAAFVDENNKWADHYEQNVKPELEGLKKKVVDLSAERGSLDARVRALDPTYQPGTPPDRSQGAPPPAGSDTFDPAKHGLLTKKDFEDQVAKYAQAQGTVIAITQDLASEYRDLTGSDMLAYATTDSEGRQLRGMSALLHEARIAKQQLPDYVATKFDFAGKRAAANEKRKQAAEELVRKDERTKVMAEMGNPNLRPGLPSSRPFIPVRENAEAKFPWQESGAKLRSNRIQRAVENQAKDAVN